MKVKDTMKINLELGDQQFAQLTMFLVSEANDTGGRMENCGFTESFASLLSCRREPGGSLVVTLECVVEFFTNIRVAGGDQERYKVPSMCLEKLMQAINLFPKK